MTPTFGAETTTDEVLAGIDLSGRRALVTGASSGLGQETARALAAHGASVVVAARDRVKLNEAVAAITADVPGSDVEPCIVDLASMDSIRASSGKLVDDGVTIDMLIANAGVMACPFGHTADGFELQFGTNHLGHFLFVNLLVPALVSGGRVVVLSSAGHRIADVDLDDPNFEHTVYNRWTAYGRSKTANVLFAVALDQRLAHRGARAFAVHPGVIATNLGRHLDAEAIGEMMALSPGEPPVFKAIPAGAATSVFAATSPTLGGEGGRYLEDCGIAAVTDNPTSRSGVRPYAIDAARAEALWARSEELVGAAFT